MIEGKLSSELLLLLKSSDRFLLLFFFCVFGFLLKYLDDEPESLDESVEANFLLKMKCNNYYILTYENSLENNLSHYELKTHIRLVSDNNIQLFYKGD